MASLINLNVLKEEVSQCTKCPELVRNRTRTVFGEGSLTAKVMFVGEGPGSVEDKTGRPFVGPAGQLLDNIIKACGWSRNQVYIANCVACRPPGNRVPTKTECDNCRSYLDAQIETVMPRYLVLLGSTASGNLLGVPVSQARGEVHDYKGIKTICTFHPAFLLRSPEKKKDVWEDLQVVIRGLTDENL